MKPKTLTKTLVSFTSLLAGCATNQNLRNQADIACVHKQNNNATYIFTTDPDKIKDIKITNNQESIKYSFPQENRPESYLTIDDSLKDGQLAVTVTDQKGNTTTKNFLLEGQEIIPKASLPYQLAVDELY